MSRVWGLFICLAVLAPVGAFAQPKGREPAPACVAACTETCQKDLAAAGCNPAVGLTACRIRQDQCVAACSKKCPRS